MLGKLLFLFTVVTSVLTQTPNISDASWERLFNELFTTPSSTDDWTTTGSSLPDRGLVTTPLSSLIDDSQYGVEKPCNGGICLPYYQCNNTDGDSLIDVRFGGEDECLYLEVCCPDDKRGCGHRHSDGLGLRITDNDGKSQYGEFPWMVALLKLNKVDGILMKLFICGGTLIHPQVVLTAAHCIHEIYAHELIIRAGEWDTQTSIELHPHQDRNVSEIIIHEAFYRPALHNDVALIFLTDPLDLAEHIDTICLPPSNYIFDGSRCVAAGWGKDVVGLQGKYQVIMKKIELPIVPRDKCIPALSATILGRSFRLHSSFICAGGEGIDTCKGDGGSPLACPIPGKNDRYYFAGIVAWGIGCGENQVPGVYVNIPKFRNWIDLKFNNKGFDKSFYTPENT